MSTLKTYRIIAVLLLLSTVVLIAFAFAGIKNSVALAQDIPQSYKWSLFALIILILINVAYIYIVFELSSNKIYNARLKELAEKQAELEKAQKEQEETDDKAKGDKEEEELFAINWKRVEKELLPDGRIQSNLAKYAESYLSNLAKMFEIVQGVIFTQKKNTNEYTITAKYAYIRKEEIENFKAGETIPGQVVKNKKPLVVDKIPENYITVLSGLGEASPGYLMLVPFIREDVVLGVMELALFKKPDAVTQEIIVKVSEKFSEKLSNIMA